MTGSTFKRKLPAGGVTWCFQIDLGKDESGKRLRIFRSGFDRKADADSERVRVLQEHSNGAVVKDAPKTLNDFIEEWFREHAVRNCEPKTVERYRQLAAYALPRIGFLELGKITPRLLERAFNQLRDTGGRDRKIYNAKLKDLLAQGRGQAEAIKLASESAAKPLSPKTIHHIAGVFSAAFETAIRWKLVKVNPVRACILPKVESREAECLDQDRLEWFLDNARNAGLYAAILIGAATGIRRGELLSLTWTDINLVSGAMLISKSLEQTKDGLRVKSTKTARARTAPLPRIAIDALEQHKAEQDVLRAQFGQDYRTDLDLIFGAPDGDYIKPDSFTSKICAIADKAGMKGVSLHTLRHSHGSQLLSLGVPLPTVSKRLGHSSTYVTASVYSHALAKDEVAAAEAWNEAMRKRQTKIAATQ